MHRSKQHVCWCRYVSSASLEALGTAFKDATLLMQRNYEIFYEELKLSCYQPQVLDADLLHHQHHTVYMQVCMEDTSM